MRILTGAVLLLASLPALATPPLFKASHPEHEGTIWLAGTVHFLEHPRDATPAAYDRALERADRVWFELDLTLPEAEIVQPMVRLARDEADETLGALAGRATTANLLSDGEQAGFPVEPLKGFEPWFALLQWNAVHMRRLGFNPENGVEQQYLLRARSRSKPVRGLETMSQQAGYFDDLPVTAQLAMMQDFLDGLDDSREDMRKIVAAWRDGDDARLAELVEEGWQADPGVAEALLFQRNADWAATLDTAASEGNTELVMVGAAHLVGARSLPEELRERGWTVDRIRE